MEIVPSAWFPTQTAPKPMAMSTGVPPTLIGESDSNVCASIRVTVPALVSRTHTPSRPAAMSSPSDEIGMGGPTSYDLSTRVTVPSRSSRTHTAPDPKAIPVDPPSSSKDSSMRAESASTAFSVPLPEAAQTRPAPAARDVCPRVAPARAGRRLLDRPDPSLPCRRPHRLRRNCERVATGDNCNQMHRRWQYGVAKSQRAARRQVQTGHYRPRVSRSGYRANSNLDADNDGTACEVSV